jgi:hypothetical protein
MARAPWLVVVVALACDSGTPAASSVSDSPATADSDAGSDPGDAAPDATATSLRVLFVGNSYTATNDLPAMLHTIAQAAPEPPRIDVESIAPGGATFSMHWNGADVQPAIAKGGRTHVVLQAQSVEPLIDPDTFSHYGALLAGAAKSAQASPVLFETWARKAGDFYDQAPFAGGSPEAMQDMLTTEYGALGKKSGAAIAPIGQAWRAAWTTHPEIELYQPDGSHPSVAGTYLAACVLYTSISGHGSAPSSGVPQGVSAGDAATLRGVATTVTAPK